MKVWIIPLAGLILLLVGAGILWGQPAPSAAQPESAARGLAGSRQGATLDKPVYNWVV
jgi:hypothetical protein